MSLVRFLSADDAVNCFVFNCTGICVYDNCTPPPLIPTNGSDPDSTPTRIQLRHPNRLLFYFLIAAASLLALSFLLLLLSYFLLRLRRQRRRLRLLHPQNHNHNHNPPPFQDPDLVDDLGENDSGTHHIWYIRTVGLDEHVIKSIAAKIYKSGEGLIDDGGDCAVCLGEFVDGEAIKILPKCSHAFHLACIDTWLRSHVNCPLCRAAVVVGPAELDGAAVEIVDTPITNGEEAAVEEEEEEEVCVVVMDLEAGSSSSSNSRREESELQPIRRSVSMDSSSSGLLMLRAGLEEEEEEKKLEEEKRQVELREEVVCKNGGRGIESLGKLGAEMKRSLSSRSGRMFFTRYGRPRGRSSSVLPL